MKHKTRDNQRSKAYAFERELIYQIGNSKISYSNLSKHKNIKTSDLQQLCDSSCDLYGISPYPVVIRNNRSEFTSYFDWKKNEIKLAKHMNANNIRTCIITVHEVAHCIIYRNMDCLFQNYNKLPADHGSEYIGVLIKLFNKLFSIDIEDCTKICDKLNVKYDLSIPIPNRDDAKILAKYRNRTLFGINNLAVYELMHPATKFVEEFQNIASKYSFTK